MSAPDYIDEICIMDSDGGNVRKIGEETALDWSPDGKKLAIGASASIVPNNWDGRIWLFDPFEPNGGVPERLTNNDREEPSTDWSDPALMPTEIGLQLKPSISTWGYIKK